MSASSDPLSGLGPLSWASAGWSASPSALNTRSGAQQATDPSDHSRSSRSYAAPCQAQSSESRRSGDSSGQASNKGSINLGLAGPSDRSRMARRLLRAAGLGIGVGGGSFFVSFLTVALYAQLESSQMVDGSKAGKPSKGLTGLIHESVCPGCCIG